MVQSRCNNISVSSSVVMRGTKAMAHDAILVHQKDLGGTGRGRNQKPPFLAERLFFRVSGEGVGVHISSSPLVDAPPTPRRMFSGAGAGRL